MTIHSLTFATTEVTTYECMIKIKIPKNLEEKLPPLSCLFVRDAHHVIHVELQMVPILQIHTQITWFKYLVFSLNNLFKISHIYRNTGHRIMLQGGSSIGMPYHNTH